MANHNHKYLDISLDEMIAREGITSDKPSSSADKVRTKSSIQFTVANSDNEQPKTFKKRKAADSDGEDESTSKRGDYSIKGGNINRSGSQFPQNCGMIFVSNLKYEVTDEDIQQLFSSFGELFRAALNFGQSGRSCGTAFVVYNHRSDAVKAIGSLKGVTLDGRALQMELVDRMGDSSYGGARANNNSGRNQNIGKRGIWNDIASNYENTPGSGGDNRQERNSGYDRRRNSKSDKDLSVSVDDLDADLDSYLAARNSNRMDHD